MGHLWALEKFRFANLLYSLRRSPVMHRVTVALDFPSTARSVRSPEMGVDRFRRALRTIAAVFVVSLVVVSAASLIIYRRELGRVASGQDDLYAAIKSGSALDYYLIWSGVSMFALAATFQKRLVWLPFYVVLAIFAEAGGNACYYVTHNHLFRPLPRVLFERFDAQPILVARPHPGDFGFGVTHDSDGRRTTVNEGKVPDPRYVYVFGGSTTYDVANRDRDTWTSRLSALLGPHFAVENYGVPGFTSLEALHQSLFVFRDHPPACAIYYEGWNDLRYSHVKDIAANFSAVDAAYLRDSLFPSRPRGVLESYSILFAFLKSVLTHEDEPRITGTLSDQPDPELSRYYRENMELIALIGREFHVKVIFVPQLLNYANLTTDRISYLLFIRDKDTKKLMGFLNNELAAAAKASGATFLTSPLSRAWTGADFADDGHFNAAGADKFAKTIVDGVRPLCQLESNR